MVPEQLSNVWQRLYLNMTESFFISFLIPPNCRTPANSHAVALHPFLEQHYLYDFYPNQHSCLDKMLMNSSDVFTTLFYLSIS
jgi:hypothetical protein